MGKVPIQVGKKKTKEVEGEEEGQCELYAVEEDEEKEQGGNKCGEM